MSRQMCPHARDLNEGPCEECDPLAAAQARISELEAELEKLKAKARDCSELDEDHDWETRCTKCGDKPLCGIDYCSICGEYFSEQKEPCYCKVRRY